ncbi:MAG: outer membrane beta-barrel protein [Chrysiogenetes bacterium]|nr:outer membrane beta-barrel protein [Chrysiogenetes bacterium]
MNRFWVLVSLVAAIVIAGVAPAHAQAEGASLRKRLSGEAFVGLDRLAGKSNLSLGVAGTWFFATEQTDRAVQFGFRPEVGFTRIENFNGSAHEYFFTANLEMDIVSLHALGEVSDALVPYLYVGGGFDYLTSDVGNVQSDQSGGLFQVGVGAKIYPLLNLYIAPQYTYIQALGATEASHHRLTAAVGVSF